MDETVSTFSSRLPALAGVGFKPAHFDAILSSAPSVGFFEIHAENYMGDGGPPHRQLSRLRQDYPLSIHGVGLSIGSGEPIDRRHLERLRALCDRYRPESFSEHLAWSTHGGVFFNDLLPLPYTRETLERSIDKIDETQNVLGRQILLENPATYLSFAETELSEPELLAEIADRSGCGLLLDVENIYVTATNKGFDAADYLSRFAFAHVREIHLAGHFDTRGASGEPFALDAHCAPVAEAVWTLFSRALAQTGPVATLVEWDNETPEWPALAREAQRAQSILDSASRRAA
ncbi:UPF0276 protein [Methylosinus sp. C49]|uniref:MNIO family bufferin maturase n=1 Tax=Methylosinus sp. C49 TaxID=2699395 RepID=UPI00136723B4|nr:DUF692 domain-containing protein [Methylosinus sp. C49]BBU62932.1 UPF0276 protein [Methylosinus sp. C49]